MRAAARPNSVATLEVDPINILFFPSPSDGNDRHLLTPEQRNASAPHELCRFANKLDDPFAPMALPSLSAQPAERWCESAPTSAVSHGRFSGQQGPTLTFISACIQVTDLSDIRTLTFGLYKELLEAMVALGAPRFVRIWNYMPKINSGTGDDECYRQFCWGRAEALGDTVLPAATGIGSRDDWLRISVLCTGPADKPDSIGIRHIENTRQVSAYNYPKEYGPRSPSFARATLVSPARPPSQANSQKANAGQSLLLVSGTSSIVHHQTLHAGDIAAQTAETLRNIQALFKSLNSDSPTQINPNSTEMTEPVPLALRYYLRNPLDLAAARSSWTANAGHWPAPAWYEADICRSDLSMEVEGVFSV